MSDPRKPSKRRSSRDIEYDPASDITEEETVGHTLPREDLQSLDKLIQAIQLLFEEQNELHAMVQKSHALNIEKIRNQLAKFIEVSDHLLALAHQEDHKVNEKIIALCEQSRQTVLLDIQSFQATLKLETQAASRMKKPKADMKTLIDSPDSGQYDSDELDTMLEEMKHESTQSTPIDSADSEDEKSEEWNALLAEARKNIDWDDVEKIMASVKLTEKRGSSALGTYSKFSEGHKSQHDSDKEEKKEKASEKKPKSNPT